MKKTKKSPEKSDDILTKKEVKVEELEEKEDLELRKEESKIVK